MSLPLEESPHSRPARDEEPRSGVATGKPLPRRTMQPAVSTRLLRIGVGALVLIALALGAWAWLAARTPDAPQIAYTELLSAVREKRVESLIVRPGDVVIGEWAGAAGDANGAEHDFTVSYPLKDVDGLAQRAEAAGVELTLATAPGRATPRSILTLLVQLLLVGAVGYFVYRQVRGGAGEQELGGTGQSDVTFADVAGTQGAADELREMVEFLRAPDRFNALGARIPKGALLVGPPGTGKTLLARAVAGEAGVPFFSISGSEVTGFLVGMGAHRIKSLFKRARKKGGVIFIDEIDALGGKRGRNRSHNEDDRTLNQLLVEMDGFDPLDGVVVIAATNRPDDLDEALKRPGRFDRMVTVSAPTSSGREEILRLHVDRRGIPLHEEVDLARLARLTPGSTGAELANLLNEAAINAARTGDRSVRWTHLDAARDRLLLGKERKGFRALDTERATVAYHEAGHALVGVLCAPEDGLHKVTIQPRGQAMGVAYFSPSDERFLYRRSYLEALIMKGLAGRAAEELVFGHGAITSGAQNDLQQVNGIARKMVYQLGMGAETGLLIHDGEMGSLSSEAHARMDREVQAILERLYVRTREVVADNREALAALAVALLERETVEGDEAVEIMDEAGMTRPSWLEEAMVAPLAPAVHGETLAA
ncbi:MAG TPA: AAA family ATPase [Longimicrobium sp.]|nr:AAA family ATPase [Longimicrobium sp.]